MSTDLVARLGELVPGVRVHQYSHIGGAQALRIYLPNGIVVSAIPEYIARDLELVPLVGEVELALLDRLEHDFITDVDGFEDQVMRHLSVARAAEVVLRVAALPNRTN